MNYRTYNLKEDMPTVELALANIEIEIDRCHSEGVKVLKIIHGYGSSGVGGEIKKVLSNWLRIKKRSGLIKDYVKGEEWPTSQKAGRIKQLYPEVLGDMELYFSNPGLTILIL